MAIWGGVGGEHPLRQWQWILLVEQKFPNIDFVWNNNDSRDQAQM